MIQPILDFFTSFLKLSSNKILIGILIALSIAEGFVIHERDKQIVFIRIDNKKYTDSLTTVIINDAIKHSIEKVQMMKDCYAEKEILSKELDINIKSLKKELKQ